MHEEQERKERLEKERKEAQEKQEITAPEAAVDQQNTEKVEQHTAEIVTENEPEQAEPRKEIPLPDLIAEFDENKANIEKMDGEIDRLASVNYWTDSILIFSQEELYGEAEEISEQQAKLKSRQEEIIQDINSLGFADIEEARASAGKTADVNDDPQKETPVIEEDNEENNENKEEEKVEEVEKAEEAEEVEEAKTEPENVEEAATEIKEEKVDEEKEPVTSGDQNEGENQDNTAE